MEVSRSAQKRLAKQVEQLAQELVELSAAELARVPCDEPLKRDIAEARSLKGGSRKRQIKYIAKALRQSDPAPLFAFLAQSKGSKLEQNREFHELERLREAILDEAIAAYRNAREQESPFHENNWQSRVLSEAAASYPELEKTAVHRAASRFAVTRKPVYRREVFRLLRAAQERRRYAPEEK